MQQLFDHVAGFIPPLQFFRKVLLVSTYLIQLLRNPTFEHLLAFRKNITFQLFSNFWSTSEYQLCQQIKSIAITHTILKLTLVFCCTIISSLPNQMYQIRMACQVWPFFFLTIFLCARYLKCTKNLIHIQIGGTWNICLTCVQEYLKLTNVKRGKAAGLVKDERGGYSVSIFPLYNFLNRRQSE